jgi:hypothetical protein
VFGCCSSLEEKRRGLVPSRLERYVCIMMLSILYEYAFWEGLSLCIWHVRLGSDCLGSLVPRFFFFVHSLGLDP